MAVRREIKSSEIRLDGNVATWDLNMVGEIDGTYLGTFKFRTSITPLQEIEADRNYRELIGENGDKAPIRVQNLAYALTLLKQRVLEAPPFWMDATEYPGSSVKDIEVIEMVFQASLLAEAKYREQLKERHLKAIESLKENLEKQRERVQTERELKGE